MLHAFSLALLYKAHSCAGEAFLVVKQNFTCES